MRRRHHPAAVWVGVAALVAALAGPVAAQQKPAPRAAPAAAPAPAPAAVNYGERYASLCAACHGANGHSDQPGIPVLAGQPAFYAITQLFLFREGRRSNEAMTAIAKTLKDDDMRGFSTFIGTLPPVPPPAPAAPPDPQRMAQGLALAQQHKCFMCHGNELEGGQQVPRIAGQHEEYLQMSLQGFKSGQRPGYTQAMIGAVSQVTPEELDTIAYYVARFPGAKPAGK